MTSKNAWIEAEKHLFGKADGKYHFKDVEIMKFEERINALKGSKEDLKKRVNFSVDAIFE